jgi:hypothetical protein
MTNTAPLFLFLFPHSQTRGDDAQEKPFLAVLDCTGAVAHQTPHQMVHGHNGQAGADAFQSQVSGPTGMAAFQMHITGQELGNRFADAAQAMLSAFAPDGFDTSVLETKGPNRFDVYSDGGIARTRDAIFWVAQLGQGCGAPTHIGDCVPGRHVRGRGREELTAALDMAKAALPSGLDLGQALDHFLVGLIPQTPSQHAALAQRVRILEDIQLFPLLWQGMGGTPRQVVPVFM